MLENESLILNNYFTQMSENDFESFLEISALDGFDDDSLLNNKKEFVRYVVLDMVELFNIDISKARKRLEDYDFFNLLDNYWKYVMHYNIEIWAEHVYKGTTW